MQPHRKTPIWMTLLILVITIPSMTFPMMLTTLPASDEARMLVWFYPLYVAASGICAWICYPQRPEVTWILLVLMILSHIGMYML